MSTVISRTTRQRRSRSGRAARTRPVPARLRPHPGREPSGTSTPIAAIRSVNPGRLKALATLTHRRWSLPVLAELHRGDVGPGGGRFVTLLNRVGVSHDSLAATLKHLIANDFVVRNPGHGHPMRPEYLLAENGHDISGAASKLLQAAHDAGVEDLVVRKWSLPVLAALDDGQFRFGELKGTLPGITSRALAQTLKDLAAAGLIDRSVAADVWPPAADYSPAAKARPLLKPLRTMLDAIA